MKRLLTLLIILVFGFFIASTFYAFFSPAEKEAAPEEELPPILTEEGIERAKTYQEHMNRGKLLYVNSYASLAIAEYESASDLEPTKLDPLMAIGNIHLAESDFLSAKVIFEEALKISPNHLGAKNSAG